MLKRQKDAYFIIAKQMAKVCWQDVKIFSVPDKSFGKNRRDAWPV